jgi:hypothetical protein
MRWLKKILAGLLLLWGLPISVWAVVDSLNPETAKEDREGAIAALIIFGLPPVAMGGWLLSSLRQQNTVSQKQKQRALEQQFLQMLQENNGVINPIVFATKTQLSLDEAKTYLDEKAVQLNGLYEATASGGIEYHFPL